MCNTLTSAYQEQVQSRPYRVHPLSSSVHNEVTGIASMFSVSLLPFFDSNENGIIDLEDSYIWRLLEKSCPKCPV